MISISHLASTNPFIITGEDNFDTNAAIGCAPTGITIPTTEPVIIEIFIDGFGQDGDAICAGGQTSMINGIECFWSLNYTSPIVTVLVSFSE